ncbi:MAG: monoamine oxidase [Arenicella sp.]|jgi:monoamine oxidase
MAGSYRLHGGLTTLIDALVENIGELGFGDRLHLASSLSQVSKLANGVGLTYYQSDPRSKDKTRHQLLCQKVVLALPARTVLENIEIQPKLNAERQAELDAVATWMAGHSKVVIEYAKPFWRHAGFSGDVISHFGPMSEIHDASSDHKTAVPQAFALFGFLGIAVAERKRRAEQLPDLIIEQLLRVFGDQAKSPINIVIQDWASEPLTASKHDQSIANHRSFNRWTTNVEPGWGGALIWSGSETANDHTNGYLEGAVVASAQTFQQLQSNLSIT